MLRIVIATLKDCLVDRGGNVAMIFTLLLPVLLTTMGLAIDYGRATSARAAMQAAADATALMISKEATNLNADEITAKARAYFNALFNRNEITGVSFAATYSPNAGNGASVEVTAGGNMKTDFMRMAGFTSIPIGVASSTRWGNMRYRVALALDNTGSMDDKDKMKQLKAAASKLVEDFYAMAVSSEDVYISIVPFSRDVNIGKDKKNMAWLRWSDWEETNGKCTGSNSGWYKTRSSCVGSGRVWDADDHDKWDGCVMDRDQDYDVSNAPPVNTVTASMPPADDYKDCPEPILGMTSVRGAKSQLLDKIDDMKPKGNTNQSIGLAWAWMTHSATGPFPSPPKNSNYTYIDAIVLLTDGKNTEDRWYTNSNDIDARQAKLCANINVTGMKVFAIQVATDRDPVSSMLKNCTSDPNSPNYFSYINQASEMTVKFQNVFKELSRLRVAS